MLSQPRESPGNATASWGPSEPPGRARLIAFLPLPAGIPPPPRRCRWPGLRASPGLRPEPAPRVGDFWGSLGGFSLLLNLAPKAPFYAPRLGPRLRAPDALPCSSLKAASPRARPAD